MSNFRIAYSYLLRSLAGLLADVMIRRAWILVRTDCSIETIKAFSNLAEAMKADPEKLRQEVLRQRKEGAWGSG